MKIIMAVNTLGSFLSHRRGLYKKLQQDHTVQVIFAASEVNRVPADTVTPSDLLSVHLSRKGTNPLAELRTIIAYFKIYQKERPDLVHHFTIKPVIYGTLAARMAGVPRVVNTITGLGYVFTSNTLKARSLGFVVKVLYRLCFASRRVRVIFQNADDRDFFVRERIIRADRSFLIEGSGVDTGKYSPSPVHNPVPKIFVAARLLIEKGILEFVEAVQILKRKGLKFEAIVAGDTDPGNPGSFTDDQVKKWQDLQIVQFLGHQTDMVKLLKQIDIACLPSYREGLPMSLLEAMSAGKPIVTTDAPGCRATVRDGKNGFLVPARDPIALAAALEKLISDAALREKMGLRSRELAVTFFSADRIAAEIESVYDF